MPVSPTHLASAAVPLAALAGTCAALGIAGLAEAVLRRRRRRRGRRPTLVPLLRRFGPPAPRDLPTRLDAAGSARTAADVMALKAGSALAGALAALPLAAAAPGNLGPLVLVATPGLAFFGPDLALARRARRRARALDEELADIAELLRVAVAAGLPPTRALAEVGRRHPGLLAAELCITAARTRLGVAHDDALDHLERRAPIAGVAQLTTALRRAHRHGAPLDPALDAVARDARAARARRRRDRAARAAPQIQLVVALLLVPAVLLLVAAGLAAALLT